jgi:arsenate reductase-like glutaredoxin family protein
MTNKMTNFGELKTKLLTKLTESYTSKNKGEIKELIKKLQSNKNLVEMYVFYEDMEKMTFTSKEKAKLFIESLEPQLIEKSKQLKKDLKEFGKILKDVISEENPLYNDLDVLSEENTIQNIAKKIDSREKLINHLIYEKKETNNQPSTVQVENHTLLNAVLVNNFNIKYGDFLNEEQKETFNKIISMSNEELISEMTSIKKELNEKIDTLIKESTDESVSNKLSTVKSEVLNSENNRYQYYKLVELKNGLI